MFPFLLQSPLNPPLTVLFHAAHERLCGSLLLSSSFQMGNSLGTRQVLLQYFRNT